MTKLHTGLFMVALALGAVACKKEEVPPPADAPAMDAPPTDAPVDAPVDGAPAAGDAAPADGSH